jgi:hypothetical protein
MRSNCSLTIYNKYIVAATRSEAYQRTVIPACAWENRKASNVRATGGQLAADQARIFILKSLGEDYLGPAAWQALSTKTGKWTLQKGDIVAKGTVTDELTDAVEDPQTHVVTPAFTVSSLKAKYDDVLVITSVDTMDEGSLSLQHWQIGAQ